jgi:hypothetical protein
MLNDTPDSTCPSAGPQKLQFKPIVWQNGKARELPTHPGDPDGNAVAINDLGQAKQIDAVNAALQAFQL